MAGRPDGAIRWALAPTIRTGARRGSLARCRPPVTLSGRRRVHRDNSVQTIQHERPRSRLRCPPSSNARGWGGGRVVAAGFVLNRAGRGTRSHSSTAGAGVAGIKRRAEVVAREQPPPRTHPPRPPPRAPPPPVRGFFGGQSTGREERAPRGLWRRRRRHAPRPRGRATRVRFSYVWTSCPRPRRLSEMPARGTWLVGCGKSGGPDAIRAQMVWGGGSRAPALSRPPPQARLRRRPCSRRATAVALWGHQAWWWPGGGGGGRGREVQPATAMAHGDVPL